MTAISLFLRVLNAALMIGIPLILIVLSFRKGFLGLKPVGIGMAGFLLSQLGHIPFNYFVLLPGLDRLGVRTSSQEGLDLLLLGITLGLSAGIFEEFTRYLIFCYWLKGERHPWVPVKYGLGHGGIEAILLGLLALMVLVQVLVLGGEGATLSYPADQQETIQAQLGAYWELPRQYALLGAWERVSALSFHLGASILVYKSFRERKMFWLGIAVLGHALLDAFAVIAAQKLDLIVLEVVLFVFAALWLIWSWSKRVIVDAEQIQERVPLPAVNIANTELTTEQLEESRYDQE